MCDKVDNVQNSTQETTIRVGRQAMSRVVISFFPTRASERRAVLLRIHETAGSGVGLCPESYGCVIDLRVPSDLTNPATTLRSISRQ